MAAHILVKAGLAGIIGLLAYSPETAKPLSELAEVLLRSEREGSSLTPGERELIASYVSSRNDCTFCCNSHSAAAAAHFDGNLEFVQTVVKDPEKAPISEKMKALLNIAGKVQISGKEVKQTDIERARAANATDTEIHDAVLTSAAFCMYNRYVDGLGTDCSCDPKDYIKMGESMAHNGYVNFKK